MVKVVADAVAAKASLQSLIQHCRSSLAIGASQQQTLSLSTALPALDVLHDAAMLAKAQATKLGIALRPPTSLDVLSHLFRELSLTLIPTLMAGIEAISADQDGNLLKKHSVRAVDDLLLALHDMVNQISNSDPGRGRLPNTGVVWSAADKVASLRARGQAGIAVEQFLLHGILLKDALAELKSWIAEEAEATTSIKSERQDSAEPETETEVLSEDDQVLWDLAASGNNERSEDATLQAQESAKRLQLVCHLLDAGSKRRMAPSSQGRICHDVKRLDTIVNLSEQLSKVADDLGTFYYEDEVDCAKQAHGTLSDVGIKLTEVLYLSDTGEEDTFSKWFLDCKQKLMNV